MNKDSFRQFWVVIGTLVMITINALANIIPFNGVTTGAVSDRFKVFFVPDGYVFSIWGLIYIALIAYSVYQALPAQRQNPFLRRIAWWYVAGCAANSAWIFMWHYQILPLTLVMMLFLLVSLIAIYLNLNIGVEKVSRGMRFLVHLPFSIYLGWITVATIANVTDVLKAADWHGFGISPSMWAVTMLVVGVVIAELVAYNRRDLAFMAVLVWAYFGIGHKFLHVTPIYEAATVAAIVILVMIVFSILFKKKRIS